MQEFTLRHKALGLDVRPKARAVMRGVLTVFVKTRTQDITCEPGNQAMLEPETDCTECFTESS